MAADSKPIFRPEAIRPHLHKFALPAAVAARRPQLAKWAALLESAEGLARKETELLPNFIRDVFEDLLGYVGPPGSPYTLKREALVKVDGKFADAGFGRFGGGADTFVAVLEGKGPRDPLDRPFGSRKRSAVEQSLQYAVQLRIDWYLVTNLCEIRLYHKAHDTFTFERFAIHQLAVDDAELKRFVFLLGAERLLPAAGGTHLDALLTDSKRIGRELTNEFYKVYRGLREAAFRGLRAANPALDPLKLLAATQKMLDRVLFIAFCEDRDLLPREIIAKAYTHQDDFNPRPIWQNFLGLFRAVDKGNAKLDISRYNGGLFAPDEFLETLTVPDEVCKGFKTLADYEYGHAADEDAKLIDVEILGHIFEQSISDLEELQKAVAADPAAAAEPEKAGPSKRKKEGAFYTPGFITRYIVAETLGPVLRDRFEALRAAFAAEAKRGIGKVFEDPAAFVVEDLTAPQNAALVKFWEAWLTALERVRIVDPSCGSGAFLIEAFEQMFAEYRKAMGYREQLAGKTIFDVQASILTNNLFGMDLNGEAVEIARLSCWIKTAEPGKPLTSLDANIIQGNSVVDPSGEHGPRQLWRDRFPAVFAEGGFDVVIGNPPYVRQEWIKADKPYLQAHYKAYDGVADLYVYFYELGLTVLKPGGRLGFISSNSFARTGFAEPLRRVLTTQCRLEQVIDLGDTQVFEDAKDVYPAIVLLSKADVKPSDIVQTLRFRRGDKGEDISDLMGRTSLSVPISSFDPTGWQFDDPSVGALRTKLMSSGQTLSKLTEGKIYRGLISGLNEAFVIDDAKKEDLCKDGRSSEIIKPYIGGQHVRRWYTEDSGNWLIIMPSGFTSSRAEFSDPMECRAWLKKTYPAVEAHLSQFEAAAIKRTDQGEFWWELRACDYYDLFERPKIIYPDIAKFSRFVLDRGGVYSNNTTYFLPSDDAYLLGVLNSEAIWFILSGISIPFGERAGEYRYRMFTQYIEKLPIPNPTPEIRQAVETVVASIMNLTEKQQADRRAVLDWLRTEFAIDKPTQKLADVAGLDADGLVAEVKKIRGRKLPLTVADVRRLKEEHVTTVLPMQAKARDAQTLERRLSDLVNEAYGLTPEDVALMWATAPPRMPGKASAV